MSFFISEFTIGSIEHIISVILGLSIAFLIYKFSCRGKNSSRNYSYSVFGLSILWWLTREFSPILDHQSSLANLPLQLCDITLILCGIALYTGSRKFYPFLIFTALGAGIALLTPTITGTRGILTLTNFCFYVTHSTNFMVILVLYKQYNMRIEKGDWIKSFSILSHMALAMIILNPILGTNFFYVTQPIENPIVQALGEQYVLVGFFSLAFILFISLEKIVLKFQSVVYE